MVTVLYQRRAKPRNPSTWVHHVPILSTVTASWVCKLRLVGWYNGRHLRLITLELSQSQHSA